MFFFKKDPSEMNIKQLVQYITKNYHIPLRQNLDELNYLVNYVYDNYLTEFPELESIKKAYVSFNKEITIHIDREDEITFPAIIKYEKIYKYHLSGFNNSFQIIKKMVNDVSMENDHKHFYHFLEDTLELINKNLISKSDVIQIKKMIKLFEEIKDSLVEHSRLENQNLYYRWIQLQEKLKTKYQYKEF